MICASLILSGREVFADRIAEFPRKYQFFARAEDDSSDVPISGFITSPGLDSIYLEVFAGNTLLCTYSTVLDYSEGNAPFRFTPRIHAELTQYSFKLSVGSSFRTIYAQSDSIVCGDVFFIAGQSNAVLARSDVTWRNEFCRTFGKYNSAYPSDTAWALAVADTNDLNPAVGVWALYLQKHLVDSLSIPICVINGAIGGRGIESMMRSASKPADLNTIYGRMLYRAQKSGLAHSAKAMFWFQGESNTESMYLSYFTTLHAAWMEDYSNIQKTYLFQLRPGCDEKRQHLLLRELQRTMPSKIANLEVISTLGIPFHDGCHYTSQGYRIIAERMYKHVTRDFYGSTDTFGLAAPNVSKIFFTDFDNSELAIVFSTGGASLFLSRDTIVNNVSASLQSALFLDGNEADIAGYYTIADTLFVLLSSSSDATQVTYILDKYYGSTKTVYEGPWILNERGVGAYSFLNFPITPSDNLYVEPSTSFSDSELLVYPNPTSGTVSAQFYLADDGHVKLEVVDQWGRVLITALDTPLASGYRRYSFDGDDLPNSLYYLKLTTSNQVKMTKFIVRK